MITAPIFRKRQLNVCYWDCESKIATSSKMHLEKNLKQIAEISTSEISGLGDMQLANSDLLVIFAPQTTRKPFEKWLVEIRAKMNVPDRIWTPALIISDVEFGVLAALVKDVAIANWYFDVVHPMHLDSLPIRVANLIRIHDHLKELKKYNDEFEILSKQVESLEQKIKDG